MSETDLPDRARLYDGPLDRVPHRLVASWQRSQDYGVPLESIDPVFTGSYDDESLFFQCGREVLTGLHRSLANEPISLMLTDAEGLVLNRFSGDTDLLRALDKVHLAPGFAYSEREAGTNGLGLALADRAPTVVRAEEHYSLSLTTYTCAAVPVLDPLTGHLEGAVNLTTWSRSSSDLLLALAQSAAGNTAALMLARSQGRHPRPVPRGEVFRVEVPRLEPGAGTLQDLSGSWSEALLRARQAFTDGMVVAAVGEPGSGRSTVLAQAERLTRPRDRILSASPPAPQDVEAWLGLWTPELGKEHTAVVVRDVDALPAWVAERLRDLVLRCAGDSGRALGHSVAFSLTAQRFEDIPAALAGLVDTVVEVPPLRERLDDVMPLARQVARRTRGREVAFTTGAERALTQHRWPGNVEQLLRVVRQAVMRGDVVDVRHLPAEVLSGSTHRLTRIEEFEREEIVRVLSRPGVVMKDAAAELGMSRATIYRKLAQYDIHLERD
ncbi:helix-turn-helix domain-containing protein [Nocardioides sp.]|uniref:helix-turn-helix domain-containing protein n=1 Tax=Nocardioides sp. TaxID=35761 RepID=UPI00286D29E3|nr:helix-turn-helix domain-containing protein [Nocardioides sp.]